MSGPLPFIIFAGPTLVACFLFWSSFDQKGLELILFSNFSFPFTLDDQPSLMVPRDPGRLDGRRELCLVDLNGEARA